MHLKIAPGKKINVKTLSEPNDRFFSSNQTICLFLNNFFERYCIFSFLLSLCSLFCFWILKHNMDRFPEFAMKCTVCCEWGIKTTRGCELPKTLPSTFHYISWKKKGKNTFRIVGIARFPHLWVFIIFSFPNHVCTWCFFVCPLWVGNVIIFGTLYSKSRIFVFKTTLKDTKSDIFINPFCLYITENQKIKWRFF